MPERLIKIRFAKMWQGFDGEDFLRSFLKGVYGDFQFVICDDADFLIYGPYAGQMPDFSGVKIFFGCENVRANMSECDWAFTYDHDDVVKHPRHMRAVFHSNERFVKSNLDPSEIRKSKTKFCNFIYSNKVPFREDFCKKLSSYKRVDCPGKSLNNCPSFDRDTTRPWWETKLEYLADYKFTIAFENSSHPGYNTEKIFQPMFVNSIPIYWGDPLIHRDYNSKSFINYYEIQGKNTFRIPRFRYLANAVSRQNRFIEKYNRLAVRINNRLEQMNHSIWKLAGFERLIQRIIEIDKNDALYDAVMLEPWCHGNEQPDQSSYWARWRRIFTGLAENPE